MNKCIHYSQGAVSDFTGYLQSEATARREVQPRKRQVQTEQLRFSGVGESSKRRDRDQWRQLVNCGQKQMIDRSSKSHCDRTASASGSNNASWCVGWKLVTQERVLSVSLVRTYSRDSSSSLQDQSHTTVLLRRQTVVQVVSLNSRPTSCRLWRLLCSELEACVCFLRFQHITCKHSRELKSGAQVLNEMWWWKWRINQGHSLG